MSDIHHMPFGAEVGGSGVRFRLWAPDASEVSLELATAVDGAARSLPMAREHGGWFALHVEDVGPDALYRYGIGNERSVPDPASRFQPRGVHGPSQVVDPRAFRWNHLEWKGRPWHEAAIYELHVGTFTAAGSFSGVEDRLSHLANLGVSAIELMPVAAFPGGRNWGYDGVLPFSPDHTYGSPDSLRRLVDEAHGRGLMVFLDVVYNHFGPEGNDLHSYAPQFFTDRFETPWGEAIDFGSRQVRDFFIHNALYWLEEFRIDGLRLDAVHAIRDESPVHILDELADSVHERFSGKRHVHLVLENGRNEARYLSRRDGGAPSRYAAQWNDDFHHAAHVVATSEDGGYYGSYVDAPLRHLGRCLAEGFAFQGDPYPYWDGRPREEPIDHLPPTAFVTFLQNHDQVGNRAMGERLSELADSRVLDALLTILLLAPFPPLLFMGEEWAAPEPFLFFCDFGEELADHVREGRRREFSGFPGFGDPAAHERIPDPNAKQTFLRSVLDWDHRERGPHRRRLTQCRNLLALRRRKIVPLLSGLSRGRSDWSRFGATGLDVRWSLAEQSGLCLLANLGDGEVRRALPGADWSWLHGTHGPLTHRPRLDDSPDPLLPPWSASWFVT